MAKLDYESRPPAPKRHRWGEAVDLVLTGLIFAAIATVVVFGFRYGSR